MLSVAFIQVRRPCPGGAHLADDQVGLADRAPLAEAARQLTPPGHAAHALRVRPQRAQRTAHRHHPPDLRRRADRFAGRGRVPSRRLSDPGPSIADTELTLQCTAIAIEATRLALIQTLLQGSNFTPLTSLYSFAPVCFATLALLVVPVEGLDALRALPRIGLQLIPNAALTFLLSASYGPVHSDGPDLSAIYLVAISSLVLSLSKVAKGTLRRDGPR